MSAYTPWGSAQHQKTYAPGITEFSTASHGGFRVSPERLAEMPAELRTLKPWAGEGWYEEDCDWSIVVLAWPEYFSGEACDSAIRTAGYQCRPNGPDDYPGRNPWPIDLPAYLATGKGRECDIKAADWRYANAGMFRATCFGSPINGQYRTSACGIDTGKHVRVIMPDTKEADALHWRPFSRADVIAVGGTITEQ